VSPLLWLGLAVAAGLGAWWIGWPAWQGYRGRDHRDANVDRYLAWRGRADRRPSASLAEGLTLDERRRFMIAAALGLVALVALIAFFVAS
jgi:hypothetical protein